MDVEADDSIFQESTFQVELASPTVIIKPEVDEKLKGFDLIDILKPFFLQSSRKSNFFWHNRTF